MALRLVFSEGYTNYGLGQMHPNGTIYMAVQGNVGTVRQVIIRRRNVNGTYDNIWRYEQGRDFQGAVGICQAFPMPDGSVVVSFPATHENNVAHYEDVIPNACPPYTPQNIYQYPASAEDRIARQSAEAAVQAAQRAERAAEAAKRDVVANGSKVEKRIGEVVEQAKRTIAALGSEHVLGVLHMQFHNGSKLAAFVWQKARDASYAHLKELKIIK